MPLEVTIDTREDVTIYHEYCVIFPEVKFFHKKLDEGDYATDQVTVERKTIDDLASSIFGEKQSNGRSRICNETDKLATLEDKIVLFLIIGTIDDYIIKMKQLLEVDIDGSILYGEIASLMTREKFHVIWASNEYEAKVMMIRFMQAVHDGKYGVPARRNPIKLMSRILKITPKQLTQLLEKYKTIQNLANQTPENYTFVKGIAGKRAEFIHQVLNSDYTDRS